MGLVGGGVVPNYLEGLLGMLRWGGGGRRVCGFRLEEGWTRPDCQKGLGLNPKPQPMLRITEVSRQEGPGT